MFDVLVAALLSLFPSYLDPSNVEEHVGAAIAASIQTGVDPDLLLAMAYVESRFNPYSLSRQVCDGDICKRVTGPWLADEPPEHARPTWYCGPLQTGGAVTWEECLAQRDLSTAYLAGATHLVEWANTPPCRKLSDEERTTCALRGYNGGWAAIKKQAKDYPAMVYGARARIRRAEPPG